MNVSGMAGFSGRELRVVALLSSGSNTRQIAVHLGIKLAVVHNYTYFVYRKMGFNSHKALIRWAKKYGLDDPNPTMHPPIVRNRKMRGFFAH